MKITKSKLLIALIAILLMYLYLSTPGKVVVNADGEINGIANIIRASVQGKRFWLNQLNEVNSELEWRLGAPERREKIEQKTREILIKHEARMEELYNKYPKMRPSSAEVQAEALRKKADQIEQQEIDNRLEEYRQNQISKLRNILPLVEGNAD